MCCCCVIVVKVREALCMEVLQFGWTALQLQPVQVKLVDCLPL